jgi:hypothetical protein
MRSLGGKSQRWTRCTGRPLLKAWLSIVIRTSTMTARRQIASIDGRSGNRRLDHHRETLPGDISNAAQVLEAVNRSERLWAIVNCVFSKPLS